VELYRRETYLRKPTYVFSVNDYISFISFGIVLFVRLMSIINL